VATAEPEQLELIRPCFLDQFAPRVELRTAGRGLSGWDLEHVYRHRVPVFVDETDGAVGEYGKDRDVDTANGAAHPPIGSARATGREQHAVAADSRELVSDRELTAKHPHR
jgi:hypothetical protein